MRLYNTLARKKVDFTPLQEGEVGIYVCGPTVYDVGHLGHGRAAVSFDVMRRYFLYKGLRVKFVSNYTDIDDKMINRAREDGCTVSELAARIIPLYEEDYGALGVMAADVQTRATSYVDEMIALVEALLEKGHAYAISDGVYFDVTTFGDYGKLSGQKLDELLAGARVEENMEKRNPQDFVVWKLAKPGEPSWASPWGEGRPGWHIECSAMSTDVLGQTFDIHGGGADLIFPHHECEIAQSEAGFGVEFARYWLHNGHIRVNQEKMSKSLGNFFSLRDIFKKFKAQAVRLMFLQTHYRSPIDFSDDLLEQASNSLMRLQDFTRRLQGAVGDEGDQLRAGNKAGSASEDVAVLLKAAAAKFEAAMDDDFETPVALAVCFDLLKDVNRLMDAGNFGTDDAAAVVKFWQDVDAVLGLLFPPDEGGLDTEVEALIAERNEARAAKNFARSDEIRDELLKRGIQLEDAGGKTTWKRV